MNKMVLGFEYEWTKNIACPCGLLALYGVPHTHIHRSATHAILCISESCLAIVLLVETSSRAKSKA